ncbi:MAG: ABC transporter ATP-binding protein [Streptomycetales bacterium]
MGPGGAGAQWSTMRSYLRDESVKHQKLAPGTLRRIGGFARPFVPLIAVLLVLVVIDAVLIVVPPLLFKRIIDEGVLEDNATLVTVLSLVVAGIAVLAAVLGIVERYYSARVGEGLIYEMRAKVFDHVQRMPLAFFARTQTGSLISRLNNDVIGAQRALTSTLSSVVSNLSSLVLVAGTMFYLSWEITLVTLALLPVFIFPAKYVGRRLQGLTRRQMQLDAVMSSTMTERFNVSGALLVKLFGRPAEEDAQFSDSARRVRDIGIKIAMSNRVFLTSLTLVAALATALVYLIGGRLAIGGTLTVGTLLALTALLGRLYGPLTQLSNVRVDVMTALVSFERIFEVLDLPPMITERPDALRLPGSASSVEFDSVSFRYPSAGQVSLASLESVTVLDGAPSAQVLHDVSFQARPGELIALVGPSGGGKTTITNLVARLYDVTGGAVRVGGHDVRDVTLESLRSLVGVVTQDAHMFHDTIRANLRYADPAASDAQLVAACQAAQIWNLVASLPDGLDTVVGERGYRLSGGEKQRLAIARVLLKSPNIVVLDEATAHLDSESEVAVQRALGTALADRTSIVIAHRLSTIRHADQILVVDDGRIVQRGGHEELLAAGGLYAELYRTQFYQQARQSEAALPAG